MSPTIDEALAHFGVKGMKWGVRRGHPSSTSKPKPKRTPAEIAARRKNRNRRIAIAGAALIVAGPELMGRAVSVLNTVAGVRMEQNGAREAQRIFSDSRGLPNFETINLHHNPSTNTWE